VLGCLAKFGMTPSDRQPKTDTGGAMVDKLRQAIRDVGETEARFTADLEQVRRGGHPRPCRRCSEPAARRGRPVDQVGQGGKAHTTDLPGQMTVSSDGADTPDEYRGAEIRVYLRTLDPPVLHAMAGAFEGKLGVPKA
jgi:hypothetical protein